MEEKDKLIKQLADDYSAVLKEAKSMGCNEIKALYNIPLKNMELIVQTLKKQIPKNPRFDFNMSDTLSRYHCTCGKLIKVKHDSGTFDNNDAPNYCRNCGQRLDWSEESEGK